MKPRRKRKGFIGSAIDAVAALFRGNKEKAAASLKPVFLRQIAPADEHWRFDHPNNSSRPCYCSSIGGTEWDWVAGTFPHPVATIRLDGVVIPFAVAANMLFAEVIVRVEDLDQWKFPAGVQATCFDGAYVRLVGHRVDIIWDVPGSESAAAEDHS